MEAANIMQLNATRTKVKFMSMWMSGSVVDVWANVLTLLIALGYDAGEPASAGEVS